MSADAQLAYERRVGGRQALLAAGAGVLLVAAAAVQISGPHTKVNELTLDLITAHKRFPLDIIGAAVNAVGLAALGATLMYLFTITRARNPSLREFIKWLALAGAVVVAIVGLIYPIVIAVKADDFVAQGAQSYPEANQLTKGGVLLLLPLLGQASALVLAVGFVMVSLNAMRVGLLTRFMGYLGIFTGILVLFPVGTPVPVVQAFWLLALAYLFAGRWPSGIPPSWRSGKAEPWPSSAEMREQRMRAAGQRSGRAASPSPRGGRAREDAPPQAAAPSAPAARTRSATPKRKRKRRR